MGSVAISLKNFKVSNQGFTLEIPTLELNKGKSIAICGANGSGKTTLLLALAGFVSFEGTYRLLERDFRELKRDELARLTAYLPQESRLSLGFDVFYTVLTGRYPLTRGRGYRKEDELATNRLLKRLDLLKFKDRSFLNLSGGEKKRVLLARTLNKEAPIVLLDEPFSELDLFYKMEFLKIFEEFKRSQGTTFVCVIHEVELALSYFDLVLYLQNGKVKILKPPHLIEEKELSCVNSIKVKLFKIRNYEPFAFYLPVPDKKFDSA